MSICRPDIRLTTDLTSLETATPSVGSRNDGHGRKFEAEAARKSGQFRGSVFSYHASGGR